MSVRSRVYRERRLPAERPLAAIIAGLWRNGEQGVWYDAGDLSTMYQDAAGTLPVYAPGQGQVDPPVGLWLDKRPGLVRGAELNTGATFAGWTTQAGWSIDGNGVASAASVSGGAALLRNLSLRQNTFYEITVTCTSLTNGSFFVRCGFDTVSGNISSAGAYTFRLLRGSNAFVYVVANSGLTGVFSEISVRELPGNHAYQTTTTSRPTLSARYNLLTGTESLATQSVTVVATTYVLKTAGPGSVTLSGAASGTYTAGSRMVTCTAGALTLTVLGSVTQADLRPANDGVGLPPYQRVTDANTYDTTGFPLYLRFDGVDDWLQTASIDFSGTNKTTLAFSARKHADASAGELLGFSATPSLSAGGFGVLAPPSPTPRVEVSVCGATNGYAHVSSTAPETGVYVAGLNLSVAGVADGKVVVRKNGAAVIPLQIGPGTGTGNFGNYPLHIGRRGGTSLSFNGRLYSLLVRGAITPDAQIAKVERYLNSKARAY